MGRWGVRFGFVLSCSGCGRVVSWWGDGLGYEFFMSRCGSWLWGVFFGGVVIDDAGLGLGWWMECPVFGGRVVACVVGRGFSWVIGW